MKLHHRWPLLVLGAACGGRTAGEAGHVDLAGRGSMQTSRAASTASLGGTMSVVTGSIGAARQGGSTSVGTAPNIMTAGGTTAFASGGTTVAASAGQAATAGQSAGGTTSGIQAFFDGATLDLRIAESLANASSLMLFLHADDGRTLPLSFIYLSVRDGLATITLYVDPQDSITVDACKALSVDDTGGTIRLLVPRSYLGYVPARVDHGIPAALEGSTNVAEVTELPAFIGHSLGCDRAADGLISTKRFSQILGFSAVSATVRGCALDLAGEISCWDRNASFLQGIAPTGPFLQIGMASRASVCGLRSNGSLACFELTDNFLNLEPLVISEGPYRRITPYGGCGILEQGGLRCWSPAGQRPLVVTTGDFVAVSGDRRLGCAVERQGGLRCWSNPIEGDLADNFAFSQFDGSYVDVAVGAGIICAITTNGEVDCISYNLFGKKVRFPGGPYVSLHGPWAICAIDTEGYATCISQFVERVPSLRFSAVALGSWQDPPCGLLLGDGRLECWNIEGSGSK